MDGNFHEEGPPRRERPDSIKASTSSIFTAATAASQAARIPQLIRMLAAPEAEAMVALRMLAKALQAGGKYFHWLADLVSDREMPPTAKLARPTSSRQQAEDLHRFAERSDLTPWERNFCMCIARQLEGGGPALSERQERVLTRIFRQRGGPS